MTKYVSAKSYRCGGQSAYHSDPDCRHVGPNHRPVPDDHTLVDRLEECDYCRDNPPKAPTRPRECPFCQETVGLLPSHLPCEEA